ncbi:MAG: hypothetical protein KBS95_07820 [Alistipes sp.]|nr:hypothetical protein [Candidatus Alistipes equi]
MFKKLLLAIACILIDLTLFAASFEFEKCDFSIQYESMDSMHKIKNLSKKDFVLEKLSDTEFRYFSDVAEVLLKWEILEDGVKVTPTVKNKMTDQVITSIIGPFIPIQTEIKTHNLLMPVGFGERFTQTPCNEKRFKKTEGSKAFAWRYYEKRNCFEISNGKLAPGYPSREQTMQWCAFSSEQDGIYMASHDKTFSFKQFHVRYYPEFNHYRFALRSHHMCFPKEEWTFPQYMVKKYKGNWHVAAKMYREWFCSTTKIVETPVWLKKSTGWLLAILKQQNDQIIWPYGDLGTKLGDVAQSRGLDIVGLFGWTAGGHDRFYPEYNVSEKMGGEQALRNGIKELQSRGIRSIIYVNGQLMDQNGTTFWEKTGRHINVVKRNGELDSETWHKFSDAPARTHGRPCHRTETWRGIMLELAKKAHALGANGIIYDQLGNRPALYCYAANHGHKVPAIVYECDRKENLDYVRNYMKEIDPEFIVITEGTIDMETSAIDLFHGCTYGVYNPSQKQMADRCEMTAPAVLFPEMLRYTLPHLEATVRHPSPVASRMLINYAITFGLRHEIESRYMADREYLLTNQIPKTEDYLNVRSKPNLKLVQSVDPIQMATYSKQVLSLQKKYSSTLLEGTFMDDEGLSLKAPNKVIAKLFVSKNGREASVVVWNTSENEEVKYSVKLSGYRSRTTNAPEGIVQKQRLGPQSVHVINFVK